MRRERQPHAVPAVDVDVRMVVELLGDLGHHVDECDRRGEVVELVVAHERVAVAAPISALEPLRDLVVVEPSHTVFTSANRESCPTCDRAAVRARSRTPGY